LPTLLNGSADALTVAELLEDIAMNALAGFGNDHPEQAVRLRQAELASERVAVLCN
jgi:hypothetical protein